jgi:hypothetical protein
MGVTLTASQRQPALWDPSPAYRPVHDQFLRFCSTSRVMPTPSVAYSFDIAGLSLRRQRQLDGGCADRHEPNEHESEQLRGAELGDQAVR